VKAGTDDRVNETAIALFLIALSLLGYARVFMLRDAYADDNCWLLAMYISDSLGAFLDSGFLELRRAPQGVFVFVHLLPYRLLENPYVVWHTLILAVQVASPIVLYRFVRHVSGDAWLAVFVAIVFVVAPLEHVVPYINTLNYRLAALLGIASLYLTDVAAREGRWGWRLPLAMVLGAFAEHMLIEAAIGFEPARALIVWNRLSRRGRSVRETLAPAIKWLAPFAAIGLALVAYKLLFKPYGIYEGMYSTRLSHFADREAISEMNRLLAFGLWRVLKNLGSYAQTTSIVLGMLAAGLAFLFILTLRPGPNVRRVRSSFALPLLLAATIIAPVLFIFFYAGRMPKLGTDSIHGVLIQPGYALLLGAIAYWFALGFYSLGRYGFLIPAFGLSLITGLGIYFSNLNLDLYNVATTRQQDFWSAFKKRFPTLPEHADFVIDVVPTRYSPRLESYFYFEDLYAYYDFEHILNRVYGSGRLTGSRRYRVYPMQDLKASYARKGPALFANKLVRWTHYGNDTLEFGSMTYVYYRGGEIFINREILKENPTVLYRDVANKPLPGWATAP
jgi:hypothetical protein